MRIKTVTDAQETNPQDLADSSSLHACQVLQSCQAFEYGTHGAVGMNGADNTPNTQENASSFGLTGAESALAVLDPAQSAALVVAAFGRRAVGVAPDLIALVDAMEASMRRVQDGDLSELEDALLAQAASLQAIFTALSVRSIRDFDQSQAGMLYLKLALRAQAQARATVEALAGMKRPAGTAIFARQANISAGHQQVNNHVEDSRDGFDLA